jgi:hypothetical protein
VVVDGVVAGYLSIPHGLVTSWEFLRSIGVMLSGNTPVRMMHNSASIINVMPKDRERYSSTAAGIVRELHFGRRNHSVQVICRISVDRSAVIIFGVIMSGRACRASHAAVP